jgi:hypothetical protein
MGAQDLEYNPLETSHRASLAIALTSKLRESGFSHSIDEITSKEEVWVRTLHTDDRVKIKVYTTIASEPWTNPQNGERIMVRRVRSKGSDAIRVCATVTFSSGFTKGYAKSNRINRTGTFRSITNRMHKKMREVYLICLKRVHDEKKKKS